MNTHKKFFTKIGFNYLVLAILTIIFQGAMITILANTNPDLLNDINILTGLSSFCNYILPFPIFYLLMKRLPETKLEKTGINLKTFITYIGITITLMWIGNLIGLGITYLLGGLIQNSIANPVQQLINNTNIIFNILVISILAPIFEEILFRKMLIDRTNRYGAKVSIILSATLFALFHGNLNQFFYAFLLGAFFAYVYIKTGKITYTIILHMIINTWGSVISLIVGESLTNLQTAFTSIDIAIILLYLAIMFIFLIIGVFSLVNINKARFNGKKTLISLKHPFKTMFLNFGMGLFILYFIWEIVQQIFH